jgi:TRAP-type mannitol/chloroaromatic compound transport system permease large subunit
MLAALYVGYVIILAKLKPALAPPLAKEESRVPIPAALAPLAERSRNAFSGLMGALGGRSLGVPARTVLGQLIVSTLPAIAIGAIVWATWFGATKPAEVVDVSGLQQSGFAAEGSSAGGGLTEPSSDTGLAEPPAEKEEGEEPKSAGGVAEPPGAEPAPAATAGADKAATDAAAAPQERLPTPLWFWIVLGIALVLAVALYAIWTWQRLEIFKMLLASFFPLAVLILAVLGSIVFGLATPTEAAAVGAFGGFILAAIYRYIGHVRGASRGQETSSPVARTLGDLWDIMKESSFLTAKTSAMVCWLFVGSSIFSAAFALLGGQEIVNRWVLSMDLTPVQFMLLAQFIIFILGWPLEWTEIIVIFMPIFIPLLGHFNIDPLFFGLLVALNLQTAFLSPPVAMAAFYLKGVSPPHVTLNQIFAGMMPFMGIQVVALALLYIWPEIGLWLPQVLYGR